MAVPVRTWRLPATALYATLPLLGWFTYWLAFFPGVVMRDSADQWRQILVSRYDDVHPAFHTGTIWLLTRLWPSLAIVSLVQLAIAALLVGHVLAVAHRMRAPSWIAWIAVGWLTVSPVFGWNVIAVWKDTPFALATIWTVALLLRVARRRAVSPADGVWMGLALALVWLFRHNGAALVIPLAIIVVWEYRRVALPGAMAMLVVCLTIVLVVRGPAYRLARVVPAGRWLAEQPMIHQVAGLVASGTPLADVDRDTLERILPLPTWRSAYRCHSALKLLFHSGMDLSAFDRETRTFPAAWAHLALRNPAALARHWTCVTRFIWNARSELYIGPLGADGSSVEAAGDELSLEPRARDGNAPLARLVRWTMTPRSTRRLVVWQPAFYLYLFTGSLVVAIVRARSFAPAIFWLPGLCNTFVWLLGAPSPQLRFQWPLVLMTPLLMTLAAADWHGATDEAVPRR